MRSETSLIQTIGRAARNSCGEVIMYADNVTDSMRTCIDETNRRRSIQEAFNEENGIVPMTIIKEIRPPIRNADDNISETEYIKKHASKSEIQARIKEYEKQMRQAAKEFNFEKAAELRDIILEMKSEL